MDKKILIEIFRDIETPDIDPQIAVAGIELVNEITNTSLEIVNMTRKIRLSKAGAQTVKSSLIRWPTFLCDMNVVLTKRKLDIEEGHQSAGYSHTYSVGGGIAVTSTFEYNAVSPQSTTAHEIGHLFRLKYDGRDDAHCSNPKCIMHDALNLQVETERVQKHGIATWRERIGLQPPEYSTVLSASNESFCKSCEHQLGMRAFFMIARKNGRLALDTW